MNVHHPVALDPSQLLASAGTGPCVVFGASGTGKTTVALHWAARRISRGDPVVVLVPGRRAAGALRDALTRRVTATMRDPAVRTPQSLAWAVLRESSARLGERPPRLVTGAESDVMLAELLAGHLAGHGSAVTWPAGVTPAVLTSRTFRSDLRELASRLVERGYGPPDLAALGRRHARPEWTAAAAVLDERQRILGLTGENAWDPAEVVDEAALRLSADESLRSWARTRVGALAIDDAHDLTAAGWRLVHALREADDDLLVLADPDSSTQTFRGSRPQHLTDLARQLSARLVEQRAGTDLVTVDLATVWRCGEALADIHRRVRDRIGVVRAGHRRPVAEQRTGRARVQVLRDTAAEASAVVGALRAWHHDPISPRPWSALAVVVRSIGRAQSIRQACARAGVPVHVPGPGQALRDHPAVRLVLLAAQVSRDPARLTSEVLHDLACGPIGGGDSLRWRRMMRSSRLLGPQAGEVLVAEVRAALDPAEPGPDPLWLGAPARLSWPVSRVVRVLRAGCAQVRAGDDPQAVLWAVWAATGLAEHWRSLALAGVDPAGARGAWADGGLDAVMGLFDAAERFVERRPGSGIDDFACHVSTIGVADDRLLAADPGEAVTITTAAGAVGTEFACVIVAGVQEGVWPDLRVRGSLLGTGDLVDLLDQAVDTGAVVDAVRQTLDDELRLFLVAVSRAMDDLLVTAVDGEDERPSALCRLVAGPAEVLTAADLGPPPTWHDHTMESVVVALRRFVGGGADPQVAVAGRAMPAALSADAAAHLLARMAHAGVAGAHPDQWWWRPPIADDGDVARAGLAMAPGACDHDPVRADPPAGIRVSPSTLESFAACPLHWYLTRVGDSGGDQTLRRLGALIHAAADAHPGGDSAALMSHVEDHWDALGSVPGWMDDRLRRRAMAMVGRLSAWSSTRPPPSATEVRFEMDVDGVVVAGIVDRLEAHEQGLRVIDLKTGAAGTQAGASTNAQLAVYQLAVEAGALGDVRTSVGAELVHVGGTTRQAAVRSQSQLTDEDRERVAGLIRSLSDAVTTGAFDATPGDHCDRCPVWTSCPAHPAATHTLAIGDPTP